MYKHNTQHQIGPDSPLKSISAGYTANLEPEVDDDQSDMTDNHDKDNSTTQFPFGETGPSSAADSTFSERAL